MGRIVSVPGLPQFNADDPNYRITDFDWFDGAQPTPLLTGNGGGPGSVASGNWWPESRLYTLTGYIDGDQETLGAARRALLAAFPHDRDVPLSVLGNGLDPDLQTWVRRYDKPTATIKSRIDFTMPLVAADPYRYGLEKVQGGLGVFTGDIFYREYADLGGGLWGRTYDPLTGSLWGRQYTILSDDGPYPRTLVLAGNGTVPSQRITTTVYGPLTAGWYLQSLTTGRKVWAALTIPAGTPLVIDHWQRTATLGGGDVTSYIFGDWLTFESGDNTFRLVGTERTAAFAVIEAFEAYE
jgi:hypothetical protein